GAILVADTSNNVVRYVGAPVAPVSLSPPTVSGLAVQGQPLTASTGRWSAMPPATYAYQWQRCNSGGAACADIVFATSPTYTATVADVGATLRVTVTASNAGGSTGASSPTTGVISGPPTAPSNTSAPTISGTPVDGQTLTASPGTWSGTQPISYAYQWQRCNAGGTACVDLAGAQSSTYVVAPADVGGTLRVAVTASNAATAGAYRSAVLGDAPRSYWRFDEPSGPLVDVQGYKNGSYVNAPTRSVPGLLPGDPDQAASFDGSTQYADVPADPAWTASPFTLEVLVRPWQLPVNRTIWSTIGPNFTGWWLNTGPNGQVRLFVGDGSAWQWQDPNVVLAANTRYDIAATYDGTNARLYLNGALISTGPATTMNGNVAGSPMRFGAYSTGPGQYWPGTIDDASFYPSALSASLIAAHYNAGLSTPPSAASSATAVVSAAAPAATAPPVVTGSAVVGATLTTT